MQIFKTPIQIVGAYLLESATAYAPVALSSEAQAEAQEYRDDSHRELCAIDRQGRIRGFYDGNLWGVCAASGPAREATARLQ